MPPSSNDAERAALLRALEEDDNDSDCCATCAGGVSAKQKLEATQPVPGNSGGVEEGLRRQLREVGSWLASCAGSGISGEEAAAVARRLEDEGAEHGH